MLDEGREWLLGAEGSWGQGVKGSRGQGVRESEAGFV